MFVLLPNAAAASAKAARGSGRRTPRVRATFLRRAVPLAGSYWGGSCDRNAKIERGEFRRGRATCGSCEARGPIPIVRAVPVGAWRSPVSALVWGTRGRGFESRRPDQKIRSRSTRPAVPLHRRPCAPASHAVSRPRQILTTADVKLSIRNKNTITGFRAHSVALVHHRPLNWNDGGYDAQTLDAGPCR